ncbi:MAG TPA: hypothetical protein VFB96_06480 [Pirellulaceae bacterium]|nr:hypothetical protein [Pirellulaceae bacterium]
MIRPNLEKRVESLEAQVAELRAARPGKPKDWRSAVAKYAGDADLQSIFVEAMRLRDADRKRAKKYNTRRKSR